MALFISILALIATFYQLYLQRVHNEKSLKPLGHIELTDRENTLSIYILNNGIGPLIIEKSIFMRGDRIYNDIEASLDLDPHSYMHQSFGNDIQKVVQAGGSLEIFDTRFEPDENEAAKDGVRRQLAELSIRVQCRDIYNNKIVVKRSLGWFARKITA